MRFVAEPISPYRLLRFHRWAMLWLKWFAAFLEGAGALAPLSRHAESIAHHWLNRVERIILSIVLLRAATQVRRLTPRPHFNALRRKDTGLRRAVAGSAMRRLLRRKSLHARIEALSQNLDRLVARLVRRLPRGLTRRRPIKARRMPSPLLASAPNAASAFAEDTS
ncbi:MAG: hypothetical protein WAU68_11660 [Vitreimonas sp.]